MKIMVIGQGGHSRVIREIIEEQTTYRLIGYLDDKFETVTNLEGRYTGPIWAVRDFIHQFRDLKFILAIGNNRIRKQIFDRLQLAKDSYVSLIHKTAVISPSAEIGNGTVIMANAVLNAGAYVGSHTIINTGSIVEHDNIVGDFVHLSPNVTLTGTVKVGDGSHIGASATLIPNIQIGEWTTIGAGAAVIRDIPAYSTAVGVPAVVKGKSNTDAQAM
ncbi:acetyltransferase [Ammoniphilus oxalaticus]|uniref:Acetyltransferase n=1 Tax=Ammoniphilus oxalaticus TaxID=66863 RepID=A0A419SHB4_9BACL|nr:acetyltransferase [Ammoniphilus oxalaticus]RKD23179.1 acetyltransferase [Ammoniphilus oxalaticus]